MSNYKIINLLESILEMTPTEWDNPNGPTEFSCPFCHSYVKGPSIASVAMGDINHDESCIYLQAKALNLEIKEDLKSKIKNLYLNRD